MANTVKKAPSAKKAQVVGTISEIEITQIVQDLFPKYRENVVAAILKVMNAQTRYLANTLALTAKVKIAGTTGKTATSDEMDFVEHEITKFVVVTSQEILNDFYAGPSNIEELAAGVLFSEDVNK